MGSSAPLNPKTTARLIELARACKAAARAVSLYPASHPAVGTTLGRLSEVARRTTAAGALSLTVLPDNLLVNGSAAAGSDPAVGELAALFHRHFVSSLTLQSGTDTDSWQKLMLLLARPPDEVRAEGGIGQLWTQAGSPTIEIQEIDYAQMLREETVSLDDIISYILTSSAGEEPDAPIAAALLNVAGDLAKLEELTAKLQERVADGGAAAQSTAVQRMLRTAVGVLAGSTPQETEAAFKNMATVAGRLSPDVLLNLLEHRDSPEVMAGSVNVVNVVAQRMEDSDITRLVAGSLISEGGASERLAEVFQALVPEPDRKRQLLSQVEEEVAKSPLGGDVNFPALWQQAEQMLTSYSDESYVSDAYGRELSHARNQALEVEQTAADPPERISGWVATVADEALRGLDLQLLLDLLSVEADPLRWRDIANTASGHVDKLVRGGDLEAACRLVERLADDTDGVGQSRRPHATAVIEQLASGPMMRHALGHLRTASDEGCAQVKRLCMALGPVAVSPVAGVLSEERDARARKQLRDILLGFGASGRDAIEQLLNAANWEVRQTAALLLREFAGAESLPGLESLLNDSEPLVQREAIRALLLVGDERNYEVLVQVLAANTSRCGETLIQQLGSQRDQRAIPLCCHLIRRLDHTKATEVYVAVIAALGELGELGGLEAVKALREALYRGEWWAPARTKALRGAAAEALRKTETPAAQQALREASSSGPRGVRVAARNQLALMEQG